jgi:hypothetical protein
MANITTLTANLFKANSGIIGEMYPIQSGEKQFNMAKDDSGSVVYHLIVLKENGQWTATDSYDDTLIASKRTLKELTDACVEHFEFFIDCQEEIGDTIFF